VSATKKSNPQKPWLRPAALHAPAREKQKPSPTEIAERVGMPRLLDRVQPTMATTSCRTLWTMMRNNKFPHGLVVGGKSMWRSDELAAWMASLPVRRLKPPDENTGGGPF
jgi:predicted DNA-binding transcriptional regulator AlpA